MSYKFWIISSTDSNSLLMIMELIFKVSKTNFLEFLHLKSFFLSKEYLGKFLLSSECDSTTRVTAFNVSVYWETLYQGFYKLKFPCIQCLPEHNHSCQSLIVPWFAKVELANLKLACLLANLYHLRCFETCLILIFYLYCSCYFGQYPKCFLQQFRSNFHRFSIKEDILNNFLKFTRRRMCQSLNLQLHPNRDSNKGALQWIFWNL